MNRDKIIEDLEKLQEDVWEHGFAGSNERELWLRESIADYIVKNCSIPVVVGSCHCSRCGDKHYDCLNGKMCYVCDNVTQGN